jgi:putative heme-binding domain-containing protein
MFNSEVYFRPSFFWRRLVLTLLLLPILPAAADQFEVHAGDRIALVGDTLFEREQESGWLETEMATSFSDRHFIVRNLGWSADTPTGASRASFDFADPRKGFELLTNEIAEVKPTVVMLGYGMASSFGGAAGVEGFKRDFNKLLNAIQAQAQGRVRFVIFSPLRHQLLPPPLPDPDLHNQDLARYTEALRSIAWQRRCPFVNLYDWKPSLRVSELTDDGIHLTPEGYRVMAREVGDQLHWPKPPHADKEALEEMRKAIIRKDVLFFDRWRPQNQTYLFGFRKYEQGKNAAEIPEFDPLVKAEDDRIANLQELIARGGRYGRPPKAAAPLLEHFQHQPLPDFIVAPGFEVNLWAEDPLLAKPIQMNFDTQGRLWVASSAVYPQIAPGQVANDKIVVLEDTKGLGRADKSTVFVDGLFIPQGVEPGDGGCYVGQSTELLHFAGTLGSDKPPKRRVVLSGFGTEDTHHMVHTLMWAPDGMLYFDQSIYIHSHIETPHGVVRLNSGGIFHLQPATMQLGIFLRGFCNPWGHQMDPYGQSFVTDGAGGQGISWGIPDATYFTYVDMRRELQSISPGGYPKFCGLEIVHSEQFPPDWQGNFITADFRAHRVVRFAVSDEGSGYVTKEMPDVLTSTNVTFRPVDEKFGPDGALYIADWANPIINHGEVDFRDPRRDHEHGRIWRITAKGRPLLPRRNFTKLSTEKLLETLQSPNAYDAQQARRVLIERGASIAGTLHKWTIRQDNPKALLDALWMYQAVGSPNDALLDWVLQSPDGRVRAAAVRVMSYWPRTVMATTGPDKGKPVPEARYELALADPFPRVRVEAVRALAAVPSFRSAELALDRVTQPMDPFLDYAVWLTINELAGPWLDGLRAEHWSVQGREKQVAYAFNALEPELTGQALNEILRHQDLSRPENAAWIGLVGKAGLPYAVDLLYRQMLNHDFDDAATARAGAALNEAASRNVRPATNLDKITGFFDSTNEQVQIEALHLAGNWGGPGESRHRMVSLASDPATRTSVREAAFLGLKKMGGKETVEALQILSDASEPENIRSLAVFALSALDAAHSGSYAVAYLSGLTNEESALPAWRKFLANAGADGALTAALPRSGFPAGSARAGIRAARESGQADPALLMALNRAAGLQGKETTLTAAEIKKLGASALSSGDATRGERIFRRSQQSCLSCHSIGGVGGHVGPDLTSIGASSPIDYLIESVLYPNKEIKDGFQAYAIETSDGETYSGIPVRENDRELTLRTAADQDVVIPKRNIQHRKAVGSLMPSGLTDNLTAQEQLDLYRFLAELGKPGPFDASKGNVARMWRVSVDPAPNTDEPKLLASRLAGQTWHRAFSLVNGRVLGLDLETAAQPGSTTTNATILAGTQFSSVKSGPVRFDLSAPPGTPTWIDGKPIRYSSGMAVELSQGVHTFVVKLEGRDVPQQIKLQSEDGTFLAN